MKTIPEITKIAIDQWLNSVAEDYVHRKLLEFLERTNGDIKEAIEIAADPENGLETGYYGATLVDGYHMTLAGSVRNTELISIYRGYFDKEGNLLPPVCSVSLREVFVYLKNGNKLDVQLTLL